MFFIVQIGTFDTCKAIAAGTMPATTLWASMAHNGSQWVAGGTGPNMAYSSDGITWNAGTGAYASFSWGQLGYCTPAGRWVVHNNFDSKAMTSTDGIAWTQTTHDGPYINSFAPLREIDSRMYKASGSASTDLYYSTNGTSWSLSASAFPQSVGWVDFATNGTVSVAVPGITGSYNYCASIANASLPLGVWTQRSLPISSSWQYVIWNGRVFMAIGIAAANNCVRSTDGSSWEAVPLPTTISDPTTKTIGVYGKPCATSDGNIYVPVTSVAGPDQTTKYLGTKDDGTTWEECAWATTFDRWIMIATDGTRIATASYWGTGSGNNLLNYSL